MKYFFLFTGVILLWSCSTKTQSDDLMAYLAQQTPGDIPEVFGPGVVSKVGRFDLGATLSPDGRSLAFGVAHESDSTQTCLYFSTFTAGAWTDPEKSPLPGNVNTFFPMFSPTGDKLYFVKMVDGQADLWTAEYDGNKFSQPLAMDAKFNSQKREAGHGQSKTGAFYFTSNRDDQYQCCSDIYRSRVDNAADLTVERVDELSSEADEESLFLSANEDYIIVQAWKNEFGTKHDLYISYQTKEGRWTAPARLNAEINSAEIEQRPFVTADNKFLFFSRMNITQEDGQDVFESDIYWVSTAQVFGPYGYNTTIDASVKYNEEFRIDFAPDFFKDVDGETLSYEVLMSDGMSLPAWMTFDESTRSLQGTWRLEEPINLKVIATDEAGNVGEVTLELNRIDS